ncbi:MAG: hypothetical protein M3162_08150 [Thermoproteota archaeon]|nr:hypothetical protein [Thermoproteota archaeon]
MSSMQWTRGQKVNPKKADESTIILIRRIIDKIYPCPTEQRQVSVTEIF